MQKTFRFFSILLLSFSLFADDPVEGLPWFTGPLLTPSPNTVGPGHVNLEPYVFYTDINGKFDKNGDQKKVISTIQWIQQFPFQFGIADGLEFDLIASVITNSRKGLSKTTMGDTIAALYYQLYQANEDSWIPSFKVGVRVQFPTGKAHRLDPQFEGIDATGGGSYATQFTFAFGKAYLVYDKHWFNIRTFFGYTYNFQTHTEGFNVYGGGFQTYGTVYPGNSFVWLLGMEYNLTTHWALSFDVQYLSNKKTTFKGEVGTKENPALGHALNPAKIGGPSNYQWSIAPGIEYNFNEHIGVIIGPWFTLAGKNISAYVSFVAAINIWY